MDEKKFVDVENTILNTILIELHEAIDPTIDKLFKEHTDIDVITTLGHLSATISNFVFESLARAIELNPSLKDEHKSDLIENTIITSLLMNVENFGEKETLGFYKILKDRLEETEKTVKIYKDRAAKIKEIDIDADVKEEDKK